MGESRFLFHVLLPDPDHRKVLVLPDDDGWMLPHFEESPEIDLLDVGRVNRIIRDRFGVDVTTFHSGHGYDPSVERFGARYLFTLENRSLDWRPPEGTRWIDRDALDSLALSDPFQRSALETWFAEAEESDRADPLVPWWRAGWLDEAIEWIDVELHRIGRVRTAPVEQVKSWYVSSVMRLENDMGAAYFKATAPYRSGEVPLTQQLSEWKPDRFPRVLAADAERVWLLTAKMPGSSLHASPDIDEWAGALRAYARIQIDSIGELTGRLAGICHNYRLSRLAEAFGPMIDESPALLRGLRQEITEAERGRLHALVPRFRDLCAELSTSGIPETLEHGDFYATNVRATPNGPIFFDWSEGCVTHPFLGVIEFIDSSPDWIPPVPDANDRLRDAYLGEWSEWMPLERSREMYARLKPVSQLLMAVQNRDLLSEWWSRLDGRPIRRNSGTDWSMRQVQYKFWEQVKRISASSDEL